MGALDHGAVVLGCEKWEGEAQDQVWSSDSGLQEGVGGPFLHPLPRLYYTRASVQFSRGRFLVELNLNIKGEGADCTRDFDVLPM